MVPLILIFVFDLTEKLDRLSLDSYSLIYFLFGQFRSNFHLKVLCDLVDVRSLFIVLLKYTPFGISLVIVISYLVQFSVFFIVR